MRICVRPAILVFLATRFLSGCFATPETMADEFAQASDSSDDVSIEDRSGEAICLGALGGNYCGNDMIDGGDPEILYECYGSGSSASIFEVCMNGCHVSSYGEHDYCELLGNTCETAVNCANCVFYARCRKQNLPYGLLTFQDKVNIINLPNAQVGAVAVIDVGDDVGHLAYVEAVIGPNLTISEGNWIAGQCGQRQGTVASLNIVGFYI